MGYQARRSRSSRLMSTLDHAHENDGLLASNPLLTSQWTSSFPCTASLTRPSIALSVSRYVRKDLRLETDRVNSNSYYLVKTKDDGFDLVPEHHKFFPHAHVTPQGSRTPPRNSRQGVGRTGPWSREPSQSPFRQSMSI
ncbi:hypothetical protein BC830DRAFT_674727 [Chytriomyces sp. MP71]|nr:hypothetical protein BC830DRAFT_674727 [Chytriomyces sp. MP71]